MSPTAGRVFSGLTRGAVSRGIFVNNISTVRLNSVRPLAVTSQRSANSTDEEVKNAPIKFSTSKASHRAWRVDRSMGSQYQQSWWKVLPISLFGVSLLLWCALRKETPIDTQLEKHLYQSLPGLLSDDDDDEEEQQNNSA